MGFMFCDQVELTPVTINEVYGSRTIGAPFRTKARVQSKNEIQNGDNRYIEYRTIIALPKNTDIANGYYLTITKLQGEVVSTYKRREVQDVFRIGGALGHWQVELGNAR